MSDQTDLRLAAGEQVRKGPKRTALAASYRKRYDEAEDLTVKELAEEVGRSPSWMRDMLLEAGTVIRSRNNGQGKTSRPTGVTVR